MKKLMVMAMVGLTALCGMSSPCAPDEIVPEETTLVYSVKMTVHTPKGVSAYVKGTPGSVCNPGDAIDGYTTTVRTTDKTHIEGWIYECDAQCDTVGTGSVVLWDRDRKVQIVDAALATELLHVIGQKQNEAEWFAGLTGTANYDASRSADYDLKFGAFGKFSTKKGYYTSFSGNFAGTVTAVYDLKAKYESACDPAGYYMCSDPATLDIEEPAVAYGTISVKYNKAASKRFAKNGHLSIPSYVTIQQ